MDFVTAIKTCFRKYVTFEGRASRAEYWLFVLFTAIVSVIAAIIDDQLAPSGQGAFSLIVSIPLLLPGIAVAVRRLHDTNRSGWWYLLVFVPLVGFVVLLVWFCQRGTQGANRFGDDPIAAPPPAPVTA